MGGITPKGGHVVFNPEKHCGVVRKGKQCTKSKGYGTDHLGTGPCKFHFGTSRNLVRYAARVRAAETLVSLGVAVTKDPQQALLELVWEAAGNVAFLRKQVQALGIDLIGKRQAASPRGTAVDVGEEVRAIVHLYGEWNDRLGKYSKLAIDAGIAERQVQLAEAQGYAIRDLIEGVLDALDLDEAQRKVGREVAGQKLRVLAGGMAA